MFINLPDNTMNVAVNDALKAPIESTLTETGLDLTAAVGCIIWIDSATGEITATTYDNGEMIPVKIETTDGEKKTLRSFTESLYN